MRLVLSYIDALPDDSLHWPPRETIVDIVQLSERAREAVRNALAACTDSEMRADLIALLLEA